MNKEICSGAEDVLLDKKESNGRKREGLLLRGFFFSAYTTLSFSSPLSIYINSCLLI